MKIYDVTALMHQEFRGYDNSEGMVIENLMSIKNGDTANVSKLILSSHFGTHCDSPKHFIDDGLTLENMPIDTFMGNAKVFDVTNYSVITYDVVKDFDIEKGDRVIFKTGCYKYLNDNNFYPNFTYIDLQCANYLVEKQVKMIGIDYLSIEDYHSKDFAVHKTILGNNIGIVEGLYLDGIDEGEYEFIGLPLKIKDGNGSPIRAVLIKKD